MGVALKILVFRGEPDLPDYRHTALLIGTSDGDNVLVHIIGEAPSFTKDMKENYRSRESERLFKEIHVAEVTKTTMIEVGAECFATTIRSKRGSDWNCQNWIADALLDICKKGWITQSARSSAISEMWKAVRNPPQQAIRSSQQSRHGPDTAHRSQPQRQNYQGNAILQRDDRGGRHTSTQESSVQAGSRHEVREGDVRAQRPSNAIFQRDDRGGRHGGSHGDEYTGTAAVAKTNHKDQDRHMSTSTAEGQSRHSDARTAGTPQQAQPVKGPEEQKLELNGYRRLPYAKTTRDQNRLNYEDHPIEGWRSTNVDKRKARICIGKKLWVFEDSIRS